MPGHDTGTLEARVFGQIRDPHRPVSQPNCTWDPFTTGQDRIPRGSFQFGQWLRRGMPNLGATQPRGSRIDPPQLTPIASKALANRAKNCGNGLGHSGRPRQCLGGGVLGVQSLFRATFPSHVLGQEQQQTPPLKGNGCRVDPNVDAPAVLLSMTKHVVMVARPVHLTHPRFSNRFFKVQEPFWHTEISDSHSNQFIA